MAQTSLTWSGAPPPGKIKFSCPVLVQARPGVIIRLDEPVFKPLVSRASIDVASFHRIQQPTGT
jgi:hypothetical protein